MNIVQFLFHLISKFGLPMSTVEYESSVAQISGQWDELPAEGDGILPKLKRVFENPITKLILAGLAVWLGKVIADYLASVKDQDDDGDADLYDVLAKILAKRQERLNA